MTKVIAAVVLVLAIMLGWFILQVDPVFSGHGKVVTVTVKQGDSMATIAATLHRDGVIASPLAYRIYTLAGGPSVIPGNYRIAQGSSFSHIDAIIGSDNIVSVTPGMTLHEVALDVANVMGNSFANGFVAAANSVVTPSPYAKGHSLEGLIAAGNYNVSPFESPHQLVAQMVASFNSFAASNGLTPTTTLNGLDAYQLITAASIDEKEGYYPVNMPKVARVIFNRLARGGPLQMDSTVLYFLGQDGGTVTPADLRLSTPYNTYLHVGLTPTPICTISSYSLDAVLHAPPGPWLYFTLINENGQMAFSSTFAQQLANERLAASRGIK